MIRCKLCVIPDTRPDTAFVDGVCSACLSYARRPTIDWEARKRELTALLDRHHGECIVPSSGGKDSTAQALKLKAMGANVTVVTARTCHLTPIGRENIDNLARHCRTFEVVPNMSVRAKLNLIGLEQVGDISWPEHVSIFTTPFRMARDLGIPLIFYGENPQDQYGGPLGSDEAKTMTRRWVSEFGGFLGMRAQDVAGHCGITEADMADYRLPADAPDARHAPEAHFLGQYLPWSSAENARIAVEAGMRYERPTMANWWAWENLDNAQTGIHDYMMFLKYGYGRGAAQISVDIREGKVTRDVAMKWVQHYDGHLDDQYAGVSLKDVRDRIFVTKERLNEIFDQFTNWKLFTRHDDDPNSDPVLIV